MVPFQPPLLADPEHPRAPVRLHARQLRPQVLTGSHHTALKSSGFFTIENIAKKASDTTYK